VKLVTRAPAKLNLCLYVGDRRSDGLHEICSLFQAVTLADDVTMELAQGEQDEIVCPGVEGQNLAAAALAAFRERFGWDRPAVRVTIEKRIPVAGGLGGGSADAGAVLRLATRGSGVGAHVEELQELATGIGADVPSQVEPGSYLVRGGGEVLERLPKTWHIAAVLLTSNQGLSTADVYAYHDRLHHEHRHHEHRHHERRHHNCADLEQAVTTAGYSPLELSALLQNDLQPAALELHPDAAGGLRLLEEAGAHVARLSGSGPTAFGLFDSPEEAEAAQAAIAPGWTGDAIVVHQAPSDYAVVRTSG
jgi:4-diphosphocytidyl-2-C-methyl-D-erythritol kinase